VLFELGIFSHYKILKLKILNERRRGKRNELLVLVLGALDQQELVV
jgi:hypothetical protein